MFMPEIAYAMGTAPQGGQGAGPEAAIMQFLPLIAIFAIFWFLLIRPQQKKAKEHKQMLSNLGKGDHVLTGGGLYGRIIKTEGDVVTLELAQNLEIKVNRNYISGLSEAPEKEAKKSKTADKK